MPVNCPLCDSKTTSLQARITQKPERETDYKIETSQYLREIHSCQNCEVYFGKHAYDFDNLYQGNYNASTYDNKIKNTYDKIMSLPPENSDNASRCQRIIHELNTEGFDKNEDYILDVGSGLCVFLGLMKSFGYHGYAIDPDPISIKHAINTVKTKGAFCGDIKDYIPPQPIALLTMNKVLEHVQDPELLLKTALSKIKPKGLCYLELPDGVSAKSNGGLINRQEFFIEHFFAFSKKSMKQLMEKAGLVDIKIKSIFEPSGKYTLYAFGRKKD